MKVLAVLYCLPPVLVPAAVRYLKLLLGLRHFGVTVEVFVIDPRSFAAPGPSLEDHDLARLLPEDLTRHVVWSPENNPLILALKKREPVRRMLYRFFEPRKREWIPAARRTLRGLDLGRYDMILSCSQPHANHLLGLELKKKTGLPWVAYFGDPWYRNPYARFATPRIARFNRELERSVLAAADHVFFTSEEMLRLADEEFPSLLDGKAGVLPHSFVPGWYDLHPAPPLPPGPVRLLHTGHFYGPRSPLPLVNALRRLSRRKELRGRLLVNSYGSLGPDHAAALAASGQSDIFQVQGMVPYLDSLGLMRQYDALLLVDAKLDRPGESVFLPSKLIDYVGAGKPILAVTPVHGATARVVTELGGVLCDVENEDQVEEALSRLLERGASIPPPDPEKARRYHHHAVAGLLVEAMETLRGRDRIGR